MPKKKKNKQQKNSEDGWQTVSKPVKKMTVPAPTVPIKPNQSASSSSNQSASSSSNQSASSSFNQSASSSSNQSAWKQFSRAATYCPPSVSSSQQDNRYYRTTSSSSSGFKLKPSAAGAWGNAPTYPRPTNDTDDDKDNISNVVKGLLDFDRLKLSADKEKAEEKFEMTDDEMWLFGECGEVDEMEWTLPDPTPTNTRALLNDYFTENGDFDPLDVKFNSPLSSLPVSTTHTYNHQHIQQNQLHNPSQLWPQVPAGTPEVVWPEEKPLNDWDIIKEPPRPKPKNMGIYEKRRWFAGDICVIWYISEFFVGKVVMVMPKDDLLHVQLPWWNVTKNKEEKLTITVETACCYRPHHFHADGGDDPSTIEWQRGDVVLGYYHPDGCHYEAWYQKERSSQPHQQKYVDVVFMDYEDDGCYTCQRSEVIPAYCWDPGYLEYEIGIDDELPLDQRRTSLKRESALLRRSRHLRKLKGAESKDFSVRSEEKSKKEEGQVKWTAGVVGMTGKPPKVDRSLVVDMTTPRNNQPRAPNRFPHSANNAPAARKVEEQQHIAYLNPPISIDLPTPYRYHPTNHDEPTPPTTHHTQPSLSDEESDDEDEDDDAPDTYIKLLVEASRQASMKEASQQFSRINLHD